MLTFEEMDENITYGGQFQGSDDGEVVLINRFSVPPAEVEEVIRVWSEDAAFNAPDGLDARVDGRVDHLGLEAAIDLGAFPADGTHIRAGVDGQ